MRYLGEFEQLILFSIIELEDEAFGGAIRETIERRTGRVVSAGAINTTLGRLHDRGLVTAKTADATPGRVGRPRKYYAITRAGARSLHDSYATMQAMAGGLLSKLLDAAEGPA